MSELGISPDEPDGVTDAEALGCTPIPNSNGKPPDGPTEYKGEDHCVGFMSHYILSPHIYFGTESHFNFAHRYRPTVS